ncbi:MAG: ribonuclease E/G [Pseudomonadota bacterium]
MREIAFDASPGEIRAVLFENGAAVELHILRGGHVLPGSVIDAKIISKAGARAFLTLPSGEEVVIMPSPAASEGTTLRTEVIRARICEPGEIKLATIRLSEADLGEIGEAQWRASLCERADTVITAGADFDDHFDIAQTGRSDLEGVTVWFERTKAGLVFDVDGSGDAFAVNCVAATEIARLLRLFYIGGAAMIDFIGMENKAARLAVAAAFDAANADDPRGFERTSINGYGLMQVIRAKPGPSILDTLFGTRRVSLSDETLILALLRAASRTAGAGVRRCVTTPALAKQLELPVWQPLIAQAARQAGAALEIVADASARGYGHVHVTPV